MLDDLIEMLIEVVGSIIEAVLGTIKDPKKQKWAIRIFDGVCITALTAVAVWLFVDFYRKENVIGAIGFAAGILLATMLIVFFVIRRRRKRSKTS